jgi:hypothetical protein
VLKKAAAGKKGRQGPGLPHRFVPDSGEDRAHFDQIQGNRRYVALSKLLNLEQVVCQLPVVQRSAIMNIFYILEYITAFPPNIWAAYLQEFF